MKYSDFEIIKKLGKGAFGAVWLAKKIDTNQKEKEKEKHLSLSKDKSSSPLAIGEDMVEKEGKEKEKNEGIIVGKEYALKIMYPKKELEESFSLGTTLSHPNLMKCYDVFVDALIVNETLSKSRGYNGEYVGRPRMITILEYVNGINLFEATKNPDRALKMKEYLPQIVAAMKYLHSNNIVHRDIKPENILIQTNLLNNKEGETNHTVKLIDYDFLTVLEPGKKLTKRVGTPYYISPEMYSNQEYDFKVDLWALGVTLYYCIVRDYPFQGNNEFELKKSILNDVVNGELIHSQYRSLILNLLQKDPSKREI